MGLFDKRSGKPNEDEEGGEEAQNLPPGVSAAGVSKLAARLGAGRSAGAAGAAPQAAAPNTPSAPQAQSPSAQAAIAAAAAARAAAAKPATKSAQQAAVPAPVAATPSAQHAMQAAATHAAAAQANGEEYNIDKAVELMRSLPPGNVELVVQVVKFTLESAKVDIRKIVQDAAARQDGIQSRMSRLRSEITDYEQQIAQRRDEIVRLESDYAETSMVRERLELADRLSTGGK